PAGGGAGPCPADHRLALGARPLHRGRGARGGQWRRGEDLRPAGAEGHRVSSGPDGEPPVLDLRLLLPCLIAWAVGARALAWPAGTRATGAAITVVLLVLLVVAGVRHRGRHARPSW